ncbi:hypothetical protein Hamer_G006475 [Homarus americanus]|uniref:Uncharacterized protein n=1 Tax=Homarus americanus TaxID=6706 RepID=A0A8J5JF52_HOMAM|nr:hypothetical protein Hamer_G006475 [Homarus americanus]
MKCIKLVSLLQSSTETRLNKFESMEAFQIAATLDPRYKLDWYHDYDNVVQDIRALLTVKYNMAGSVDPTTTDTSPAEPPPMKRNNLCPGQPVFYTKTNSITEVSLYLNQPCPQEDGDPLATEGQATLSFLSHQACSKVPGHSCYIGSWERLFSIAGKLFRPERCNCRLKI